MICPSNVLLRQIYSDLIILFVQICDYCYEDYMEKGGYYDSNDPAFTNSKKI